LNLKDCFDRGLLKKGKPDLDNALRSLRISEDFLEKARKNVRIKCYDVSVMLSYTSMFHAARAGVPVYLKGNDDSNKEGEMETASSGYGGLMDVFVK
jgi:hypothetical protein